MQRIAVCGAGYVGLVTAACFAALGYDTVAYDTDAQKIGALANGRLPFYEPQLAEVIDRARAAGRLRFSHDGADAYTGTDVIFIAVGTPVGPLGEADLTFVRSAARDIAHYATGDVVVVNKSTVPVETVDVVSRILRRGDARATFRVASNPEFLREGAAVDDFLHPDRIVIGTDDPIAAQRLKALYAPLDAPVLVVAPHTAEMIKYAANAFLATKLSFVNELANLCASVDADIDDVLRGIGYDGRIGTRYMQPGIGFGGSCLPKDVSALVAVARAHHIEPSLLDAVLRVNERQVAIALESVRTMAGDLDGACVAIAGLAFKPETDDVRESPAIALARALHAQGSTVRVHDPVAMPRARTVLPNAYFAETLDDAATGADVLVCATPWRTYLTADLATIAARMKGRGFLDARNAFDPGAVRAAGLNYASFGRGALSFEAVA